MADRPVAFPEAVGERTSLMGLLTAPAADSPPDPYRAFVDALGVALYTTDADGHLTYYNEAAVQLWGRRPAFGELWCGSWRLFWLDGRHMAHEECPMAITLKEGRPVRGEVAIAERPDGSRVHFEPYPSPLRDDAGRLVGGVNVLIDVTERYRAERELASAAEALIDLCRCPGRLPRPRFARAPDARDDDLRQCAAPRRRVSRAAREGAGDGRGHRDGR